MVIAAQAPPFIEGYMFPSAGNYREGLGSSIYPPPHPINHCALVAYPPQNPPFANSAPGTLRWTHRPPSPTPNPQQTGSTRGSTAMRTPLARARRGGRAKVTYQRPVPNCHQPRMWLLSRAAEAESMRRPARWLVSTVIFKALILNNTRNRGYSQIYNSARPITAR